MYSDINCTLLTSWPEIEQTWAELSTGPAPHSLFQEPAIQHSWWQSLGEPELKVLRATVEGKTIAMFPLCQRRGTLQFLGDQTVSDYLDVCVDPQYIEPAFQAFGEFLKNDADWQNIELVSIPEQSPTRTQLAALSSAYGWQCTSTQQDVCPIIELPASWDEYLAQIGKKQRHEVTRKWRRLGEQGSVQFRVVTDTRQHPSDLEDFFRLHRLSSPEKARFWTPALEQYFRQLSTAASEHGWLRLYFLDFNGQPAATMFCFAYQQQLLVYNSGFDPITYEGKSVGNVLTSYTIQDAIAQRYTRYDFLRGGEEYKFRYRAVPHPVFNVLVQRASAA